MKSSPIKFVSIQCTDRSVYFMTKYSALNYCISEFEIYCLDIFAYFIIFVRLELKY